MSLYYFDTSIWLDIFEDRNEQQFQKSDFAQQLLNKIITANERIIVSDVVLFELKSARYSEEEINALLQPLKPVLDFIEASEKQLGKAKDLAAKRSVPKGDALHALIARDQRAMLVSWDKDFQKLLDIITPKNPRELI